jgi:hypothetical protein
LARRFQRVLIFMGLGTGIALSALTLAILTLSAGHGYRIVLDFNHFGEAGLETGLLVLVFVSSVGSYVAYAIGSRGPTRRRAPVPETVKALETRSGRGSLTVRVRVKGHDGEMPLTILNPMPLRFSKVDLRGCEVRPAVPITNPVAADLLVA